MTILTIRKISQQNVIVIADNLGKDLEKYDNLDMNDTQKQLAKVIGINERNIRNNIEVLKQKGVILRIRSDKGGHWKVIK